MFFRFEAACGSDTGKVRINNEDNYCFNEKCLEPEGVGPLGVMFTSGRIKIGISAAVFDGLGGENFGEEASFAAAFGFLRYIKNRRNCLCLRTKKSIEELTSYLNNSVLDKMSELHTTRMGTTMVSLHFSLLHAYFCNIGDSRAYCFRDGELIQLSQDHVEKIHGRRKTPLTQHLGIDPEYMRIEPYITKVRLQKCDRYLLCSDGLTDMLTDVEIAEILRRNESVEESVQELIREALEHGGRDNITVVSYKIL